MPGIRLVPTPSCCISCKDMRYSQCKNCVNKAQADTEKANAKQAKYNYEQALAFYIGVKAPLRRIMEAR